MKTHLNTNNKVNENSIWNMKEKIKLITDLIGGTFTVEERLGEVS